MKKTIVFLCLIFYIISLTSLPAKASDITPTGDSLDIGEDIRSKLQVQPTDKVIRVYNVGIYFAFSEYDNIEEILASGELLQVYYVVMAQDGTWTCRMDIDDDNDFDVVEMEFSNYQALDVCLSGNVANRIASDVEVYNTYYLSGETSHMGTAIYYKTNKGDYVYYNRYDIGECLFPVEAFCEFQKAVIKELSKDGHKNGIGSIDEVWDLSAFDLDSDTFDLSADYPKQKSEEEVLRMKKILFWISVPIGICLLIAGIVFGLKYFGDKRTAFLSPKNEDGFLP